jgi:hypothetical protein
MAPAKENMKAEVKRNSVTAYRKQRHRKKSGRRKTEISANGVAKRLMTAKR